MKRLRSAIIAILCVVCLVFGVVACGDDETDNGAQATYSVTVTGGTPTVLSITTVKLQDESGKDATTAKHLTLNSDSTSGTATFKLNKGKYTVVLDGDFGDLVPSGNTQLTSTVFSTTITLAEEAEVSVTKEYKVRFLLPDGEPAANLGVQVCNDKNCFSATTDANGWATWNLNAGNYEVHVPQENWPEKTYFDDTKYTLSATTLTVSDASFVGYVSRTVKVNYVVATEFYGSYFYEPGEPANGVKIDFYALDLSTFTTKLNDTVLATATTDAKGEATFEAPNVELYAEATAPAGYAISSGESKLVDKVYDDPDIEYEELQILLYKAGSTEYTGIKVTPSDTPVTVDLTADANAYYYQFTPAQTGEYTIASAGDLDVSVELYAANGSNVGANVLQLKQKENDDDPDEYDLPDGVEFVKDGDNFTITLKIGETYLHGSNSWVFLVGADVAEESSFTFTLKRTGDYSDPPPPEKEIVEAEHILDAKDMPAIPEQSTFTFLQSYSDTIVKGDDGFYHLESKDGALIYASLGDKYPPYGFSDGGFATCILASGGIGFTFSDGKKYNYDYIQFATDYTQATALNADGLHPLNDELKTFLGYYGIASQYSYEGEYDCYYACGYYKEKYTAVDMENNPFIGFGEYKVTVPANGETDPIYYTENFDGIVSVVSGNATLVGAADGKLEITAGRQSTFKFTNSTASEVTVLFTVEAKTADKNITAVGDYIVIATPYGSVSYNFTVPATGEYAFTVDGFGYDVELNTTGEYGDEFTYYQPVSLTKGQKIAIKVYVPMFAMDDEIVVLSIAMGVKLGENTVTGDPEGTTYTFAPTTGGTFAIEFDATGHVAYEIVGTNYGGTVTSGDEIMLYDGKALALICYPYDQQEENPVSFKLTITKVFNVPEELQGTWTGEIVEILTYVYNVTATEKTVELQIITNGNVGDVKTATITDVSSDTVYFTVDGVEYELYSFYGINLYVDGDYNVSLSAKQEGGDDPVGGDEGAIPAKWYGTYATANWAFYVNIDADGVSASINYAYPDSISVVSYDDVDGIEIDADGATYYIQIVTEDDGAVTQIQLLSGDWTTVNEVLDAYVA